MALKLDTLTCRGGLESLRSVPWKPQLAFRCRNAIANLADLAGKVTVTVEGEKADGLDNSKLQNGVIEPLKEADLIS